MSGASNFSPVFLYFSSHVQSVSGIFWGISPMTVADFSSSFWAAKVMEGTNYRNLVSRCFKCSWRTLNLQNFVQMSQGKFGNNLPNFLLSIFRQPVLQREGARILCPRNAWPNMARTASHSISFCCGATLATFSASRTLSNGYPIQAVSDKCYNNYHQTVLFIQQ